MKTERTTWPIACLLIASFLSLIQPGRFAIAQEAGASATPSSGSSLQQYRIWPGDVLVVRVFAHPELTQEVVVDERGMIRLLQIAEEVRAACRTTAELRVEIASLYRPQGNYHIYVAVKESKSPPVIITGGVRAPNRFQLRRGVRLAEVLALAGGTTENARGEIVITRSPAFLCDATQTGGARKEPQVVSIKALTSGDESANPFIQPGDRIDVPEVGRVYVVGMVTNPLTLLMIAPLTVSQAIARAGGLRRSSASERVHICRQTDGGTKVKSIFVDLKEMREKRAEDTLLEDDDVVYVPARTGGIVGPPYCYPRPKRVVPDTLPPGKTIY